jgi:hypothetical protein
MVTVSFKLGIATFVIQEEEPEDVVEKLGRVVAAMNGVDQDKEPPQNVGGLKGPTIN